MRAVVFLMYLCFFLLGKNNCVATAMQHNGYAQAHAATKSQQQSISTTHAVLVEDVDSDSEQEYFIEDEAEDEDTDSLFAKKSKLAGLYYFAFSHLFFSDHSLRLFNALASIQGESSPKYITQRVLRI